MVKVSIIIPVYKVEQYIKRCICSILAQESANCNLECVVVNDCTPDNSMEIISNDLSVDQLEIIDDVIKRYKNNTASELELLTTAIYAYTRIHASTQKAVYDSIKRIKGEKYSDDEIEWAINEFPYFDIAIKQ